jgi:FRG domain
MGPDALPLSFRTEVEEWSWHSKEQGLLRNFAKSNVRWLKEHYAETFIESLALAQHHRLSTRLLDWTESPLIAAFFACSDVADDPEHLEEGALWRLHTNAVRFELTEERYERTELSDGSHSPAIPENTPNGLKRRLRHFPILPAQIARQTSKSACRIHGPS